MGTGKTSVGRCVAQSLGFDFVDTDQLIEEKEGRKISAIFEKEGEIAFREMERDALRDCARGERQVISTGGGIVTQPQNIEILRDAGYVIWLQASPQIIYERVRRAQHRPLLQTSDPLATIEKLIAERGILYREAAHFEITTDNLTLDETCFGVTESARLALGA